MTPTNNSQKLPVTTQEQALDDKTKVTISKAAFVLFAIAALAAIAIPSAVLGKLYKDEKEKNDGFSCDEVDKPSSSSPHAMTTWWVIFNSPENCTQAPDQEIKCGAVDIFGSAFLETQQAGAPDLSTIEINTDAGVAMLYATGGVTDAQGNLRMQASIFKSSDILSLPYAMDPMATGVTLTNPDAEVHLILRDHDVSVGDVSQTLADSDEYCDDPPFLWFGSKQDSTGNICSDFQYAAFAAGESGSKKLEFAATGVESKQGEAHLFRQGDGLQAVIFTNVFENAE